MGKGSLYFNLGTRQKLKMPPKKPDPKGKTPAKSQKPKPAGSGGKAKKKKWSKGKVRDKLYKEVPTYKLITPSVVSERLKVRVSLARAALAELSKKGLIIKVVGHNAQQIFTRATNVEA